MQHDPLRRSVAEFVGAFTLIFIGGGAGIVSGHDIVAVALANGLAIGIMVSNLGHISGGHFNPAITLAFLATRRISAGLAAVYLFAQFLGAVVAALGLRFLLHKPAVLGAVPSVHTVDVGRGLVIEIVLTFFLVWAVWATAVDPGGAFKSIAGLAIGLTITIDVLMGGPLTGAAMSNLQYDRWVEDRKQMVAKLTNGEIGYLHIKAMDAGLVPDGDAVLAAQAMIGVSNRLLARGLLDDAGIDAAVVFCLHGVLGTGAHASHHPPVSAAG